MDDISILLIFNEFLRDVLVLRYIRISRPITESFIWEKIFFASLLEHMGLVRKNATSFFFQNALHFGEIEVGQK